MWRARIELSTSTDQLISQHPSAGGLDVTGSKGSTASDWFNLVSGLDKAFFESNPGRNLEAGVLVSFGTIDPDEKG